LFRTSREAARRDFRTAPSQTVDLEPFLLSLLLSAAKYQSSSTSIGHLGARRPMPSGDGYHVIMAILSLLHEAPKDDPAQQHDVANGFSNRPDGRPRERGVAR